MEYVLAGVALTLFVVLLFALKVGEQWKDKAGRLEARLDAINTVLEASRLRLDEIQKEHAAALEKAKKEAREPTFDCRELLHDLTEGAALVKITRISPLDVYIRRS